MCAGEHKIVAILTLSPYFSMHIIVCCCIIFLNKHYSLLLNQFRGLRDELCGNVNFVFIFLNTHHCLLLYTHIISGYIIGQNN